MLHPRSVSFELSQYAHEAATQMKQAPVSVISYHIGMLSIDHND